MDNELTEFDMELGSGIAAFESRHFSVAAGLLSPLADAGNPQAQYRMAIMAQNGLGMHENHPLAFKYMKAAAEAGLDIAQHGLGFMYMEGECTEKDSAQAVHWFTKAAEQGLAGSQTTLAMMAEWSDEWEWVVVKFKVTWLCDLTIRPPLLLPSLAPRFRQSLPE